MSPSRTKPPQNRSISDLHPNNKSSGSFGQAGGLRRSSEGSFGSGIDLICPHRRNVIPASSQSLLLIRSGAGHKLRRQCAETRLATNPSDRTGLSPQPAPALGPTPRANRATPKSLATHRQDIRQTTLVGFALPKTHRQPKQAHRQTWRPTRSPRRRSQVTPSQRAASHLS